MQTLDPRYQGASVRPKTPAAVCYTKDLRPKDPFAFEQLWQSVEDVLPAAFEALDDGTICTDDHLLDVLRNCLALHFAWSRTLEVMSRQIIPKLLDDRELQMRTDPNLVPSSGLAPAGAEGAEILARQARERIEGMGFTLEHLLPERFMVNYQEAKRRVTGQPVEIAVAEDANFLIGDAPAQTLDPDKGLGPLGGVPWDQARTVFMPLGPRHSIALAPATKFVHFDVDAVTIINSYQVARAQRHVIWHPISELEEFVRNQIAGYQGSEDNE